MLYVIFLWGTGGPKAAGRSALTSEAFPSVKLYIHILMIPETPVKNTGLSNAEQSYKLVQLIKHRKIETQVVVVYA